LITLPPRSDARRSDRHRGGGRDQVDGRYRHDVRRTRELLAAHDPALGHDPLEDRRRRSIVETILTGGRAGDQLARAAGPRTRRPPITTRSVVFAVFLAVWAVAVVTVLSRQGTDGAAPLGVPTGRGAGGRGSAAQCAWGAAERSATR
jgi:hypothetical protein